MMIYAIVDGVESNSTALGNAPNFAARRAYLQQRSTYETLGTMAGETLPAMKAVLEAIAYACFLFVIPLSLLPFGWKFLMRWGQILLWLQMWAPLYAILNYIMTLSAKLKTVGALSLSNIEGVTIASSVGIYNLNCDIASQAGYLAMSIPFLYIALVKGVGSFVTMASHLGGVGQSAASTAAGEITTGNFSFGNISEGNQQIANTNMLSQSRTASYKAGSFNMQDGRTDVTSFGDGSKTINVGNSNLPISLNMADSMQSQQSEMASQAQQKAFNLSTSAGKSLSSSLRDTMDLSERLSSNEHFADGTQSNVNSEQTRSISKVSQIIQDFAKSHGIEDKKAAEIIGNASAGLGLGKNSMSIGGSSQMNASQTQQYSDAQKLVESQDFQEAFRQVSNESKNLSYTLSDDQSKSLAENISDSYESGITQRSEALKSFNESESWSKQAMFTKSNSATINTNKTQEFVDWLANQPADNTSGNLGYQAAAHIIANNPKEAMEYMNRFGTQQGSLHQPIQNEIDQGKSNIRGNYDSESRVLDNAFQEKTRAGIGQSYQTNTSQISPSKDYSLSKNNETTSYMDNNKSYQSEVEGQELPYNDDKVANGYEQRSRGRDHEYEQFTNLSSDIINHSNLVKQGEALKTQVNDKINSQSHHINEQESHITQDANKIQEQVKAQQSKGIHNRLAQKGIEEVKETAEDVRKIWKGEPQQK